MRNRDELLEELCDTQRSSTALPGWCTVDKAKRIAQLVDDARARLCVELGVFGGRSLVAMALGGNGRQCEVHGIDPYAKGPSLEGTNDAENEKWWSEVNYEDVLQQCRGAIAKLGLEHRVRLIRARSLDVIDLYEPGIVDVLHQDSNHSEEVSCAEVKAWSAKLALGGFWIFDDVNWPSTQRAQQLLEQLGFQRIEAYDYWAVFQAVGGRLK